MTSKVSSRIGRMMVGGVVLGGLSLGLLTGSGAAHAQDNESLDGTSCVREGVAYPTGTLMGIGGKNYQCFYGFWVEVQTQRLESSR